jgi:hypothetical protein
MAVKVEQAAQIWPERADAAEVKVGQAWAESTDRKRGETRARFTLFYC